MKFSGVIGIYLHVKFSVFICITVIKYRNSPKLYLSILLISLVQGTKIGGAMAHGVFKKKLRNERYLICDVSIPRYVMCYIKQFISLSFC